MAGKVQHRRGHAPQRDRRAAGVFDDGGAGDQVAVGQHAVQKRHRQAQVVPQGNAQRFGPLAVPEGRQAGQAVFAGERLRPGKAQVGGDDAVGKFRLEKGRMVVPQARGGPLLQKQVGVAAGVAVGALGQPRRGGAGAVVQVQQAAGIVYRHGVGGAGGVQGVQPAGVVDVDHGQGSFGRDQWELFQRYGWPAAAGGVTWSCFPAGQRPGAAQRRCR